jgi:hypothetical protein
MKHTQGPWHTTEPNAINGKRFICTEGPVGVFYTVAITMGDAAWSHIDDAANARLIAAAPDLLDALRMMLSEYEELRFEQPERWPTAAAAARAAIAKAGGAT